MKILVTGSSGQLGKAVADNLKSYNHDVIGIDIVQGNHTDVLIDITEKDAVEQITKNIDVIIHTAALHGKHYELNYAREDFINTNILGTLNLLNAAVKNGVSKFLYTSTTSIYGTAMIDDDKAVWVDELLIEQPRDIYDITKQTAEQLCKDFFYKEGLQTSVYRVGRFLPETENLKINHRLYRGLDERDGAEALRLGLLYNFKDFEIFNITSGSPFLKEELTQLKAAPAEIIKTRFPKVETIYRSKKWQFPESIDRVYVCDKAKRILKYKPQYTFEYLLNQFK